MTTNIVRLVAAALCIGALGACSHISTVRGEIVDAAEQRTPAERVRLALELLDGGEADEAKAELEAALQARPGDATAARLLEQINTDPRQLLGTRSRSYVVREGDTMSGLAERFLGDPLMFYALSRYNDIASPRTLAAGRTIYVPDRSRTSASAPPNPPSPLARTPAPTVVAPYQADPRRAGQLRLAGLEELNRGDADAAVRLLQQAQVFDRDNDMIRRDLERALRVQASLRRPS